MLRVAEVDADATRELRRAVLRPNRPSVRTAPGDDAPGARHLAAYDGEDVVVGAAVLIPESCPLWPDREAFRLRGMAVDSGRQGQGIGAVVLDAALGLAHGLVWCNARSTARRFYERHGFVAVGDEFVTADAGVPHFLMYRNLSETPPRPT